MKLQSAIIGSAGEHLAISLLLRRNLIAGLAPQNTEDFDIVVMTKSGQLLFPVQVKASTKKNWMLSLKHENAIKNLVYIFVRFSSDLMDSEIYILDSKKVAEVTSMSHSIWLKLPNKDGGKHNDSMIRNLKADNSELIRKLQNPEKYLDSKDLLFIMNHSLGWLDKYKNSWGIFEK